MTNHPNRSKSFIQSLGARSVYTMLDEFGTKRRHPLPTHLRLSRTVGALPAGTIVIDTRIGDGYQLDEAGGEHRREFISPTTEAARIAHEEFQAKRAAERAEFDLRQRRGH